MLMDGYHFLDERMSSFFGRHEKPWTVGETRTLTTSAAHPIIKVSEWGYHAGLTPFAALCGATSCAYLCKVRVNAIDRDTGSIIAGDTRTLIHAVDVGRNMAGFALDWVEQAILQFDGAVNHSTRTAMEVIRAYANGEASKEQANGARYTAYQEARRAYAEHDSVRRNLCWGVARAAIGDIVGSLFISHSDEAYMKEAARQEADFNERAMRWLNEGV